MYECQNEQQQLNFAHFSELTKSSDKELQSIRARYSHLLPASRWLIDPANPANNVYISGMSGKDKVKGWETFAMRVDSIDLNQSVEKILKDKKQLNTRHSVDKIIVNQLIIMYGKASSHKNITTNKAVHTMYIKYYYTFEINGIEFTQNTCLGVSYTLSYTFQTTN